MASVLVLPSGRLFLLSTTSIQGEKSDPQPLRGVQQPAGGAPVKAPPAGPVGKEAQTGTRTPAGPPAKGQPNPMESCMSMLPLFLGMFALMYFLVIRPQQKTEKARKAMLAAIKKGDKVATSGGMHGEVDALDEQTVTLKLGGADGMRIKFDRAAIGRVLEAPGSKDADGKKHDAGGGSKA